jgi:hypothetical protein
LYSSVAPVLTVPVKPPNTTAEVCVPAPAKYDLAVFKPGVIVVQVEPLYSSVAAVIGPWPPAAKAAV